MLLKCYYHLHPLIESKRGVVDQKVEEDMSLDIFEMITNTSEPSMKLINREFLIFKRYQVDVKNIKCPMQCWE
jgi:energy-converting hydrogenase A subunit M